MSRNDAYLNAMLQQLGASYYRTLHGEGTASDVARAVDAVTQAEDRHDRTSQAGPPRPTHQTDGFLQGRRRRRWRVRDVMTTDVATADRHMTYKRAVRLMTERRVNAIPVVDKNRRVLGMVSEADVLRKEERDSQRFGVGLLQRSRRERAQAEARNVGGLMTSPAITIHPDAPIAAAARLMNAHHIRRLPVIDGSGELMGVVSRRDLMKVFLRPDGEIEAEVRAVLADILLEDADGITASVREGVVILAGTVANKDMIPVATKLASDVPGVVAVTSHLTGRDTQARAEPENPE